MGLIKLKAFCNNEENHVQGKQNSGMRNNSIPENNWDKTLVCPSSPAAQYLKKQTTQSKSKRKSNIFLQIKYKDTIKMKKNKNHRPWETHQNSPKEISPHQSEWLTLSRQSTNNKHERYLIKGTFSYCCGKCKLIASVIKINMDFLKIRDKTTA